MTYIELIKNIEETRAKIVELNKKIDKADNGYKVMDLSMMLEHEKTISKGRR